MAFGIALGLVCGLTSLAPPAQAGPWARERGDVFLSFGIGLEDQADDILATGTLTPEQTRSLYAEVGLGRQLTFGTALSRGADSGLDAAFLRYTLTDPAAPWQAAFDLGAALRREASRNDPQVLGRIGLSSGRGFGAGSDGVGLIEGGWTSLEARAYVDPTQSAVEIWQAEATLGLRFQSGLQAALGLKAEEWPDGEALVSVHPALMLTLNDRNTVQLGARVDVTGSQTVGLSLALWHDF